jgi:hypothetical protein
MQVSRLGAAVAACVVVACSSFGSDSEPVPQVASDAGEGGVLPEGGAPDTGTCTNVDSDATNCGRCGHSCQGGACSAGRCQPIEMARFTDEPTATVVLSRTHVLWNTMQSLADGGGKVYSCPKTGCSGAPTVLPAAANVIRSLGSDGDQKTYGGAFYTGGGLFQLGPSSLTPRLDLATAGDPLQMSVRPDALFFATIYDAGGGRTVHRWDYMGNVTTKPCVFATGEVSTAAAFTTARAYLHTNGSGKIYSCPLVGQSGQFTVFTTNLYLDTLVATADRVFWAENGVVTSSPDGDTSTTLQSEIFPADVGSKVTSLTISGGDLFATTAGGELWSCTPSNCKATLRSIAADGMLEAFHSFVSHTVAADADAVYYVAVDASPDGGRGSSRLMKVAR